VSIYQTKVSKIHATGPFILTGNGKTVNIFGINHYAWAGNSFYIWPHDFGNMKDYSATDRINEFKSKFPVGTVLTVSNQCSGGFNTGGACGGVAPQKNNVLAVQSGSFGLRFDVQSFKLLRFGLHESSLDKIFSLELPTKSVDFDAALPESGFRFAVGGKDGAFYDCTGPDLSEEIPFGSNYPLRTVKDGRFHSHVDLVDLRFTKRGVKVSPTVLTGTFEIITWPKCVTFKATAHAKDPKVMASVQLTTMMKGAEKITNIKSAGRSEIMAYQTFCVKDGTLQLVHTPDSLLQVSLGQKTSSGAVVIKSHGKYDAGSYKVSLPTDERWQSSSKKLDYSDSYLLNIENKAGSAQSCPLELWRVPERNVVGLSAMLYTADGKPSGIPVQLSKNWHSYKKDKLPTGYGFTNYQGNWLSVSTVINVPANSKLQLTLVFAYAHFGGLPSASHAQLSLIGWGGGGGVWHESALGSFGEQICYQPSGQSRRSMVTDVRPLDVCGMGSTSSNCKAKTWTQNVGGADFLVYFDQDSKYQWQKWAHSDFISTGPCLTNVSYTGVTADEALRTKVRVSLGRTNRYNKNFHHLQYRVQKKTTPSRLAFYQLGADFYNENYFTGAAYGGKTLNSTRYINASEVTDEAFGGKTTGKGGGLGPAKEAGWGYVPGYYRVPCPEDKVPCWFFLPAKGQKADGAFADRALIIRWWDAVLGGKRVTTPHFSLYRTSTSAATTTFGSTGIKVGLEVSPPPDVHTLLPGDYVNAGVELVVLPRVAQEYNGNNAEIKNTLINADKLAAKLMASSAVVSKPRSIAPAGVELKVRAAPRCQAYRGDACGRWYVLLHPTKEGKDYATGPFTIHGNKQTMNIFGINHWAWAGTGFYIWPHDFSKMKTYSATDRVKEFNSKFPVGTVLTVTNPVGTKEPAIESPRLRSHWQTVWQDAALNSGAIKVFKGKQYRLIVILVVITRCYTHCCTKSQARSRPPIHSVCRWTRRVRQRTSACPLVSAMCPSFSAKSRVRILPKTSCCFVRDTLRPAPNTSG
jgi:hypothetical protein